MGKLRYLIVNLFIALLVTGSLYDIATDQEHWPFSQYPMFSGIWRSHSFTWYRLVAVGEDDVERPLDANQFIRPFDQSRLHLAVVRIAAEPDAEQRLHAVVANCLERYERQRASGRHDGPPIRAMRLYKLGWTLDPDARNVDAPEVRQLMAEAVTGSRVTMAGGVAR